MKKTLGFLLFLSVFSLTSCAAFWNFFQNAAWAPSTQSGLSAWYEADSGVTGTTQVTAWADKTANGNNLAVSGVLYPALNNPDATLPGPINKSLTFSSSLLIAPISASLSMGTGDVIFFALVKSTIFDTSHSKLYEHDDPSPDAYWGLQARNTGWFAYAGKITGGLGWSSGELGTPSENTWYRLIVYRKTNIWHIVQNDVDLGSSAESSPINITQAVNGLCLGNSGPIDGPPMSGSYAIVGVYKGVAMDATLQTNIDTYLKNRGGL